MSSSSIKFTEEGCTSPDFLENLFRRPVLSPISTQSSIEFLPFSNKTSCSTLHKENSSDSQIQVNSPLMFHYTPNKIIKRHSLSDDRITSNKFKIFFKTFLSHSPQLSYLQSVWDDLERSMLNPFDFDRFIEDIRIKTQQYKLQTQTKIDVHQESTVGIKQVLRRHKSQIKTQKTSIRDRSQPKQAEINESTKQTSLKRNLLKEIHEIKCTLLMGQNFIRKK